MATHCKVSPGEAGGHSVLNGYTLQSEPGEGGGHSGTEWLPTAK